MLEKEYHSQKIKTVNKNTFLVVLYNNEGQSNDTDFAVQTTSSQGKSSTTKAGLS
jgi:hypothetical protein